jgi:hypothetical protein
MHERIDTSSHELIAARECIALLRNTLLNERDAARAEGIEMEEALKTVTAERDRLAAELKLMTEDRDYWCDNPDAFIHDSNH